MIIAFLPEGKAFALYTEAVDLSGLGSLSHRRASHVEPSEKGAWRADLSPVGGPILGPYPKRSEALTAEVIWLEAHLMEVCGGEFKNLI